MKRVDGVYVKVPSERGFSCHANYIYQYGETPNEIRGPDGLERSERFDEALIAFPEFQVALRNYGSWGLTLSSSQMTVLVHWLMIHRINPDRLKRIGSLAIPESRFIFLRTVSNRRKWIFFGPPETEVTASPAIVQEAIDGVSLWDMYNPRKDTGAEFL